MNTLYVHGVKGHKKHYAVSVIKGTVWLEIDRDGIELRIEITDGQLEALYYAIGAHLQDEQIRREACERNGFTYSPGADESGPVTEGELLRRHGTANACTDEEIIRRAGF